MIGSMLNRYLRNREGQSMVEFALVLPLLLLMLGGIIDFGHAFYQYSSIENVARDVARRASINSTVKATDKEITDVLATLPANWAATVTIAGKRISGEPVTATVTCKSQTFFGGITKAAIPDPLTTRVTAAQE